MNKIIFFLPFILISSLFCIPEKIKLESSVIKIADGTFINADKIEYIRKYRRKIIDFILGELLPNNQRKSKYNLLGKSYNIEELARIEQEVSNSFSPKDVMVKAALEELLTRAKAEFIVLSNEFIQNGRGAKNIMVVLITEDCQKRNRPDSFLLDWANTTEGMEATTFDRRIGSFNELCCFLGDLANFLFDLVNSCPKAEAQFKNRVAKWSAAKEILPVVLKKAHAKGNLINEAEFLKYLKERYLDSLTLAEITPQVIAPLLTEYIKHTNTYA